MSKCIHCGELTDDDYQEIHNECYDKLTRQLEAAKRVLLEIKEAAIYWDESENIPNRVDDALAEIEAKQ